MGRFLEYGLDNQCDVIKAQKCYERAVEKNNNEACIALGLMYENGKAGTYDIQKAIAIIRWLCLEVMAEVFMRGKFV